MLLLFGILASIKDQYFNFGTTKTIYNDDWHKLKAEFHQK